MKLIEVIKLMLQQNEEGIDEFYKIERWCKSWFEKRRVRHDKKLCEDIARDYGLDGKAIPILMNIKSREVLRDIVSLMMKDTTNKGGKNG